MYVGHAALALVLKSRRPDVPMLPLVLACYGPDFLELSLTALYSVAAIPKWSHTIPAIAAGALIAGGLFAAFAKRPGAGILIIGWMLHWPLDFVSGLKPLIWMTPLVGLDLYHHAYLDVVVESILVVVACGVFSAQFARTSRQRRVVALLGIGLIMIHMVGFAMIATFDNRSWSPSLALAK